MTISIVAATVRDACYVAANMREADRDEIGAVLPIDNPAAIALMLLQASGDWAFVAHQSGQPAAVFGVTVLLPHVASGWAFGTDRMKRAAPAMTRHCMKVIGPRLLREGFRRVEVRTAADHDLSHRWLKGMGAKLETPEPYVYGREGQLFVTYGWGRP